MVRFISVSDPARPNCVLYCCILNLKDFKGLLHQIAFNWLLSHYVVLAIYVCMCPLCPAPGFPTIRWGRISPLCWRTLTANRGLVSVDSLKAAGSAYVCSGNTHTHTAHIILLCFSVNFILQTIYIVFCILHLLSCLMNWISPPSLAFCIFQVVIFRRLNIFHKCRI